MSEEQRLSDARNFIANCDVAPLGSFPGERWAHWPTRRNFAPEKNKRLALDAMDALSGIARSHGATGINSTV